MSTAVAHRPAIEIRACEVRAGDRIVQDGFIGMTVDYMDAHPFRAGFVVIDYTIVGGITGQRTLVAQQRVTVQRSSEEAH